MKSIVAIYKDGVAHRPPKAPQDRATCSLTLRMTAGTARQTEREKKMTITIRANLTNNSTARSWGGARAQDVMDHAPRGAIRHNGGKTVIVTCDESDETEMRAALESSSAVASVE